MSRSRTIVRLMALAAGVGIVCGPSAARAQVLVWQSYQDAGKKAIDRGCYDEAVRLYTAALQEVTQPGVFEPRKVATSTSDLGYIYTLQHNYAEAERLTQWALHERERLLGPIHREVAESLVRLGRIYIGQGRFAEAEPPIRRAVPILTKANKTFEHPEVAEALELLAESLQGQGQFAEALAQQDRALSIRERVLTGRTSPLEPIDPSLIGFAEQLVTSLGKAAALLRKVPCAALEAEQNERVARQMEDRASAYLVLLAEGFESQAQFAEAVSRHQRALNLREKLVGDREAEVKRANQGKTIHHDPELAGFREQLAKSLKMTALLLPKAPSAAAQASEIPGMVVAMNKRAEGLRALIPRNTTTRLVVQDEGGRINVSAVVIEEGGGQTPEGTVVFTINGIEDPDPVPLTDGSASPRTQPGSGDSISATYRHAEGSVFNDSFTPPLQIGPSS